MPGAGEGPVADDSHAGAAGRAGILLASEPHAPAARSLGASRGPVASRPSELELPLRCPPSRRTRRLRASRAVGLRADDVGPAGCPRGNRTRLGGPRDGPQDSHGRLRKRHLAAQLVSARPAGALGVSTPGDERRHPRRRSAGGRASSSRARRRLRLPSRRRARLVGHRMAEALTVEPLSLPRVPRSVERTWNH